MSVDTSSALPGLASPVSGHPFFPFDDDNHLEAIKSSARPSFYSPTQKSSTSFQQLPMGDSHTLNDAERTKFHILQKNPMMFQLFKKRLRAGCQFHPSTLFLRNEIHSFMSDLRIVDASQEIKSHKLVIEDTASNTWFTSSLKSMFSGDHSSDDASVVSAADSDDPEKRKSGAWVSPNWMRSSGNGRKPSTSSLSPLGNSGGWSFRKQSTLDAAASSPLDNKQHGRKHFSSKPSVSFRKCSIEDLEIPHCNKTESFTDSDSSTTCSRTSTFDDETSLSSSPTAIEAQQ